PPAVGGPSDRRGPTTGRAVGTGRRCPTSPPRTRCGSSDGPEGAETDQPPARSQRDRHQTGSLRWVTILLSTGSGRSRSPPYSCTTPASAGRPEASTAPPSSSP